MKAGSLRHRVTIEQLTTVLDSDGLSVEEWTDVFDFPLSAEIVPLSGREFLSASSMQGEVTTRITVRYRAGIVPAMRAVHRDRVYNIKAVLADGHSGIDHLTLMCADGVNEG